MKTYQKVAALSVLGLAALAAAAAYLLYAPAPAEPRLTSRIDRQSMRVGQLDREFLTYAPATTSAGAPLVILFHGSMGTAEQMRVQTGFEFDRLADAHGFVVVYPQGYEGHWNDCRRVAPYSARALDIDDIGFVEALIARLARERAIDPRRVYVAGLSNGGQFVFRLALERPELIAGAAVFGANLPTPDNNICRPTGTPPPIMLVNGTEDPISPYGGGVVTIFGFGNRGTALSAEQTARYFALQRGDAGPTIARIDSLPLPVEKRIWSAGGRPGVVLYAVEGGGHVVPQPRYRPARLLGQATRAINGPVEAWRFFAATWPRHRRSAEPITIDSVGVAPHMRETRGAGDGLPGPLPGPPGR